MAIDIIARGMANTALAQVEDIINGQLKLFQYGTKIQAQYNIQTGTLTIHLINSNNEILDTTNVFIAAGEGGVELGYKLIKGEYVATTNEIVLTLANGEQVAFPLDALSEQYQPLLTFDEMPTLGSKNPVESNGIYKMIDSIVQGKIWVEDDNQGDLEIKTIMTYKLTVASDEDGQVVLV